jgi:hypothetical protein
MSQKSEAQERAEAFIRRLAGDAETPADRLARSLLERSPRREDERHQAQQFAAGGRREDAAGKPVGRLADAGETSLRKIAGKRESDQGGDVARDVAATVPGRSQTEEPLAGVPLKAGKTPRLNDAAGGSVGPQRGGKPKVGSRGGRE